MGVLDEAKDENEVDLDTEDWDENDPKYERDPREDWFDDGSGQVIPEGSS